MNLLISILLLATSSDAQQVPDIYMAPSIANGAPKSRNEVIPNFPETFSVVSSLYDSAGRALERKRMEIRPTCVEIETAVRNGMYATFQESYWYDAQVLCNHAIIAKRLKPFSHDFLGDKNFSDLQFFTSTLPPGSLDKVEEADTYNLEHGKADISDFSYTITANSIERGGYNFGIRFTFSLQYAGDLNGDGFRDMVIEIARKNLGGTGYSLQQVAVTRTEQGGDLVRLELDWVMLASGAH